MSLEDTRLPALVIQNLYQNTLVSSIAGKIIPAASPEKDKSVKYLGGNQGKIMVLVNDTGAIHLQDAQLNFLAGILTACKLNLNDVAIVNYNNYPGYDHQSLTALPLGSRLVLMFGVGTGEIDLPFTIPYFQVQEYNNQQFMSAPALNALQEDVALKKQLWTSLQKLFL